MLMNLFADASARAPQAGNGYFLAPYLVILATAIVCGIWVNGKIKRLMMARSPDGPSPSDPPAGNRRNGTVPILVRADHTSELGAAVPVREALVARTLTLYKRAWREELLVALGYWIIPQYQYLLGKDYFTTDDNLEYVAFMYLFFATLRRLSLDQLLRPTDDKLSRSLSSGLFASWGGPTARPQVRIYFDLGMIGLAIWSGLGDIRSGHAAIGAGSMLAAAFHIAVLVNRARLIRGVRNQKLTVLRVFGMDKAAELTFEGMLTYWRHFGTFYTVADSTYLQSEAKGVKHTLLAAAGVFIFSTSLGTDIPIGGLTDSEAMKYLVTPLTLALCVAYLVYSVVGLPRLFIRNQADLLRRLKRVDGSPRNWSLTFKSVPLMCYDDTWKLTVSACVEDSDAVLMDLRGYTVERKGCEYEVSYLLDTVAVSRVVFLVDATGADRIEALILARWQLMHATSPNQGPATRRVHLYVTAKEDNQDVQCILDLLLAASSHDQPQASAGWSGVALAA